jgi:hypothetical protein
MSRLRCLLLCLLLALPPVVAAQSGPAAPAVGAPDGTALPPGVQVPGWDELTPAQREILQPFGGHWDRIPAWRRVRLLENVERIQRLPPERRRAAIEGLRRYGQMNPQQRERARRSFEAMRRLPPEERRALQALWQSMTPEQRRAWLETGGPGISPPPQREPEPF